MTGHHSGRGIEAGGTSRLTGTDSPILLCPAPPCVRKSPSPARPTRFTPHDLFLWLVKLSWISQNHNAPLFCALWPCGGDHVAVREDSDRFQRPVRHRL